MTTRPIENKYREGKLKRTLKREFKSTGNRSGVNGKAFIHRKGRFTLSRMSGLPRGPMAPHACTAQVVARSFWRLLGAHGGYVGTRRAPQLWRCPDNVGRGVSGLIGKRRRIWAWASDRRCACVRVRFSLGRAVIPRVRAFAHADLLAVRRWLSGVRVRIASIPSGGAPVRPAWTGLISPRSAVAANSPGPSCGDSGSTYQQPGNVMGSCSHSVSRLSNPGRDRVSNPGGCQGRTSTEMAGLSRDMAPRRGDWVRSGENPGESQSRKVVRVG
ncbi:hypothetical protein J6590_083264 [Homalodisca vitripennis]|nr:hypothetical protein J6590_083264 [Homalodisca vitripennis]